MLTRNIPFSRKPKAVSAWVLPFFLMLIHAHPGSLHAEENPWEAEFTAGNGLTLQHRGIPLIRQSTLHVVRPGWTGLLFSQPQVAHRQEPSGGDDGAFTVTGENSDFRAVHRFAALDDRRFRLEFTGELLRDTPADIEFAIGYFNANLLAGRPFRAETADGPVEGRVPDFPAGTDQIGNDLVPGFQWIEFDTVIGQLKIEIDAGGERVLFFDARRDPQGWARRAPVFWCGIGVPSRGLAFGKPVRVEMLITLDPAPLGEREESATVAASWRNAPAALSPRDRPIQVIPTPKSQNLHPRATHRLRDGAVWSVSGPERDSRLYDAMARMLDGAGVEARQREGEATETVVIRIDRRRARPSFTPPNGETPEWLDHPEGYRLTVTRGAIEIAASTSRGAYYGLQTLTQLLRPGRTGMVVPQGSIEDWPTLSFRGAHWFPSASGVPFHEKLTERIFSRHKLNHAVIQCEAAVWESQPEIAAPNSIGKPALEGLVKWNRSLFIEPIPLINIPGHAEWLFRNGQNLDFAEDPETPYAYCVHHPRAEKVVTAILEEAIDLFRPSIFHLGHDEVTMRGRFPHPDCPRCQGETATSLVSAHIQRKHAWLAERGLGMMIWGDMMLAPEEIPYTAAFAPNAEEAALRRAALPRDVMITDWHYDAGEDYPSLDLFQKRGHPVIASTWHNPLNIRNFAQAAIQADAKGLLQTTWAGYFPDESVLRDGLHQFSAFLLAAEYAWSGRADPPAALPFDPGTEFVRLWFDEGVTERRGRLIDLSTAARTPREGWLDLGPGWDFRDMPTGRQRLGEILFNVPDKLAVVGGHFGPEGTWRDIRLPADGKAGEIALLHTAAYGAPAGTVAAQMTVRYRDGSEFVEKLVLGRNAAHWGNDAPSMGSVIGWSVSSPVDTPVALRVTRVPLPHPDKELAEIHFTPGDPEQAWALAGVTLLE